MKKILLFLLVIASALVLMVIPTAQADVAKSAAVTITGVNNPMANLGSTIKLAAYGKKYDCECLSLLATNPITSTPACGTDDLITASVNSSGAKIIVILATQGLLGQQPTTLDTEKMLASGQEIYVDTAANMTADSNDMLIYNEKIANGYYIVELSIKSMMMKVSNHFEFAAAIAAMMDVGTVKLL